MGYLFVDKLDSWRLSATQDCCFISHERLVFLHVTILGNTIHHQSCMQQWPRHMRRTLGMYWGARLFHARAQPAYSNIDICCKFTTHNIRLEHKARTKALASSMPMHNRCNKIKNITENLSPLTHATKVTTHTAYTRHLPRRLSCPCPCTTDFNVFEYIGYNWNDTLRHPITTTCHTRELFPSMPKRTRYPQGL